MNRFTEIAKKAVTAIGRQLWFLENLDEFDRVKFEGRNPYVENIFAVPVFQVVDEDAPANLIGSKLPNGNHAPVLDLDFPAHLVPSTTEGHFHLYLDKEVSWRQYSSLLWALREAGLIEDGYYKASIAREQTLVRIPGVKKTTPTHPGGPR